MPNATETPAASSTKTEPKTSELAAAAAAGQSRAAAPPPAGAGAPPPVGAPDAATQKAAADKAASDAAAAAAGKGPSWHPADEKKPAEGSPEAKAAADKAAAEKKVTDDAAAAAKAAAPDQTKFEIKAPEGVKVEPALLEKYRGLAKDLGLSQEQMQKLYDRDSAVQKASEVAIRNEMDTTDKRWGQELVTSWGPKAVENDALAKRGWDAIDPTGAVRKGLKEVGLLNWPVATNAMVEFARQNLKEDSLGVQTVGKSAKKPLPPEEAFAQGYKDRSKPASGGK